MVMWLIYLPIGHVYICNPMQNGSDTHQKISYNLCFFPSFSINCIESYRFPLPLSHGIVDMTTFSGLTVYIFTSVLDTQTNIQFIIYLTHTMYLSCIVHLLPWLSFWSKSLLPKLLDCPKPRMLWKQRIHLHAGKQSPNTMVKFSIDGSHLNPLLVYRMVAVIWGFAGLCHRNSFTNGWV